MTTSLACLQAEGRLRFDRGALEARFTVRIAISGKTTSSQGFVLNADLHEIYTAIFLARNAAQMTKSLTSEKTFLFQFLTTCLKYHLDPLRPPQLLRLLLQLPKDSKEALAFVRGSMTKAQRMRSYTGIDKCHDNTWLHSGCCWEDRGGIVLDSGQNGGRGMSGTRARVTISESATPAAAAIR